LVPVPLPLLVIVPPLLIDAPDSVIVPVPVAFRIRLLPPDTLPLKVRLLPTGDRTRSLLSVTPPLKMLAALSVIVATPVLPDATTMGLAKVPASPPLNVALAEPPESPIVITLVVAPNEFAFVPVTVPDLIVRPPVNVFAEVVKFRAEVALFSTTPVTLAPTTALMSVEPTPVPEFVIVPILFTAVVDSVIPFASVLLLLRTRLPAVLATPPDTVNRAPPLLASVVPTELFVVSAVVLMVSGEVALPSPVDFSVRLPPVTSLVTPPLRVRLLPAAVSVRSWLLSVTAPLKMLAALSVMVATP